MIAKRAYKPTRNATGRGITTCLSNGERVLSVFRGIGLLDRAFLEYGFDVHPGPELIDGVRVEGWHPPHKFHGAIAGSPCQDFSDARRAPWSGHGVAMIREFLRIVAEADCEWFILENVRRVPPVRLKGYTIQRLLIDNRDCGGTQRRLRCIQFGSKSREILRPCYVDRPAGQSLQTLTGGFAGTVTEAWATQQWAPVPLDVPRGEAIQRIANGVPRPLAITLALAVFTRSKRLAGESLCPCGCGRVTEPRPGRDCRKGKLATVACRQRVSRGTRFPPRPVTLDASLTRGAVCSECRKSLSTAPRGYVAKNRSAAATCGPKCARARKTRLQRERRTLGTNAEPGRSVNPPQFHPR